MDLLLPSEGAGPHALLDPKRCVHWLRRLYDKAIGGFYRLHLDPNQWLVSTGRALSWPIEEATDAISAVFPSMRTDIVLDRRDQPQRLVIDTKFTSIFGKGWYRKQSLKTGYIYQLYAYLWTASPAWSGITAAPARSPPSPPGSGPGRCGC